MRGQRSSRLRSWRVGAALLLTLILAGSGSVVAQDIGSCRAATLTQPLLWPQSAAWDESGSRLLVTDVLAEQVVQISPDGGVSVALKNQADAANGDALSSYSLPLPTQIHAVDGGYLLEEDKTEQILQLNRDLEVVGSMPIQRKIGAGEAELRAIFDWTPMGTGILAYGDLQGPGDSWHSAFLYLDADGRDQIFQRLPTTAEVRRLYLRSQSYLAALGDVGYILFLESSPAIGEVRLGSPGVRRLPDFPADFRSVPRLEPHAGWRAPRNATYHYKVIERTNMPVGLFAWREDLYLLGRKLMPDGETGWWMVRLDPTDGSEINRVRLPSRAAHLTVAAGETFSLVEKGPVLGIGPDHAPYMDTFSAVFVPAAWLRGPVSGWLDNETRIECVLSP